MKNKESITGVILAGGLARRMDHQDKGLVNFKGLPLINYAITAMQPVVDELIINANRNIGDYRQFGLPVISDQSDNFDGPLAGILTAMDYCQTEVLLVMPCDSPLMRSAQLQTLIDRRYEQNADAAVAVVGGRWHPVFLAIKTALKTDLQAYLAGGHRKVETWLMQYKTLPVDFSSQPGLFMNINTLDELVKLERQHL
ncbi:MAG: molybdenum cofactor guanylyltransferase [Methylovulum sp.]|uniref:molybdenum cofactor guanylyltransferase MobA n=1 Tax=Methylovulum sp. TaxID=1916980 RepID=UPI00262E62DB|nr:molybdenum cofactor guanylyltransferase MobA [Methylovulum sp.]MDD2723332.1 molybdenum cofactor guanylyltransferase [Methylovulum sp.]MDD5124681.1 molybdenum cofactor guanylyltransferase [Methylovulum sp.]